MHVRKRQQPGWSLAGYWQTFPLEGEPYLPLAEVDCTYSDVIIAFVATDDEGNAMFTGPNVPTRQEVALVQGRGQRVFLSIGGGGVSVVLDTPEKVTRFSESLVGLIETLCVDGIDLDVENGIPAEGSPCRPEGALEGLIQAVEIVLGALPPWFGLTMAPETLNMVGGITQYGGPWGNYLPLVLRFGHRLTRVHMQYYNTGPMRGIDGQFHEPGTVDFVVSMTEAVIRGFPIAGTGVFFPGLPPWKVGIGLPATPQAAVNGYLSPAQVSGALRQLCTGCRPQGKRVRPYPQLGGLMTWSVQWDASNGYAFARNGVKSLCESCRSGG